MKKKTQKNNKSLKKALKRKKYVRGSKTTVKNPSQKDLENMRKKGLSTTLPTTPAKKKTTPTTIPGPSTPKGGSTPVPKGRGTVPQPVKADFRTTSTPTGIPARQGDLSSPFVDTKLPNQPTSGSTRGNVGRGRGVPTTGSPRGNITVNEAPRGLGGGRPNNFRDFQQQTGVGRDVKPSTPPPPPRITLTAEQRKQAEARKQEAVNDLINRGMDATNAQNTPVEQFAPMVSRQSTTRKGKSSPDLRREPTPKPDLTDPPRNETIPNPETPSPTLPDISSGEDTGLPPGDDVRDRTGEDIQNGDGGPPPSTNGGDEPPEGDPPPNVDPPPPTTSDDPVTRTGLPDDAPVGITQQAPEADLERREVTKLDPETGITKDEDIEQLGEAPEADMTDVDARTLDVAQGTAQQAGLETGNLVERFDPSTVTGQMAPTTAAQSEILATAEANKYADAFISEFPEFNDTQKFLAREWAKNSRLGLNPPMPEFLQSSDFNKGLATANKVRLDPIDLIRIEAGQARAEDVDTAQRDKAAEEAAMAEAATRPETKEYAIGVKADDMVGILPQLDPETRERIVSTLSAREQQELLDVVSKEGINLDDIPEFKLAERREAQVGEAQTRIANELGDAPSLDLEGREAITGTAPAGDASQIGGVPTLKAAERQAVTKGDRNVAAADMNAVVANMPTEISAAIAQNPATVEAQIDTDKDPVVVASVAALPKEALVSTQMESLLAGMEEGETPAWARPAVDAINQQMARRGLSVSTVGRDALFNAIIQSALPIAQSNATALQQRAQQNLTNEQQANLATAQNTMQVRMQNLANRQTAASQTAQMAQQIAVQQGTFDQQARMTTAQQQQQTELANAQMAQQRAQQESAQRQQAAIAELDANTRLDLANLQALNAAGTQNLNAEQQANLATYNARVARIMRQAEFEQDIEKANLSSELQVELANLREENVASRETMTAENQERLAELNVLVDFKKTNATLAQQMDLANLNNEQQMELANLSERARTDAANFTEANRFRLQELTTFTSFMAKNEDIRQRAELAQLSAAEKVQLANLSFKNQADSESMTAENRAELLSYEKRMQAATVNAQLAQQLGLAELSNEQQAAMFNAQIDAGLDMRQFDANQQAEIANSKFLQSMTMTQFNADQQSAISNAVRLTQVDLANADARTRASVESAKNFLSIDMANLNNRQQGIILDQQMRQQALLSDQAAQNAAKQFGATSANQLNQFLISQANSMKQFNTSARNAMASFNATEANRMEAIEAGNFLQADQFTAQLEADINKFNVQIDNQRDQWNAANAQAVEQSNINWRRQANTIDTAAQNAANQQNVQNAYNISALDQTQLWQQLRDEATYIRTAYENEQARKATLIATAIGNESGAAEKSSTSTSSLLALLDKYI